MTRPRPLFGSPATSPLFVDLTDDVGTLPLFPTLDPSPAADARPAPVPSVGPAAMRHAPERCDWPEADDDPTECGRPAVTVYTSPAGADFPRCRRHDTAAAQRRAAADGWTRRPVAQEDPA